MDDHTRTQQSARPDTMDDDDKRSVRLVWTSPKRGQKGPTHSLHDLPIFGPWDLGAGASQRRSRLSIRCTSTVSRDDQPTLGDTKRKTDGGEHRTVPSEGQPERPCPRCAEHTTRGDVHPAADSRNDPKNHSVKQSNPRTCVAHVRGLGRRRVMRGGTGRWPPTQGKKPPPRATHTRTTCQPEPAKRKRRRRRRGATRQYGHP